MVRPLNIRDEDLTGMRGRVARFVENPRFICAIAVLIVTNAIVLGLETYDHIDAAIGAHLHLIDQVILAVFVIEIALKLYVYRLSFFRQGWNVFDFVIITASLLPSATGLSVLRTLRILRLLRLLSIVPQMQRVITALFSALPGMGSVVGVLFILFYISAVMASQIFGTHPDEEMQEFFGDIGLAMYSLFTVMTLEDWPDIANPTIALFPWSWVFFISFIVIMTFAVLNLFIGIIVDAMNLVKEEDIADEKDEIIQATSRETDALHDEIQMLRHELKEIRSLLRDRQ